MPKVKWNAEERRQFAETKLRATTIPNKKRAQARKACRKRAAWHD